MRNSLIILAICFAGLSACKNKNPNLSKEEVILSLQQQEKEAEAKKQKKSLEIPSDYVPPPGIRHQAVIKQTTPVVHLDMLASLENDRPVKLSDFGREIVYYRTEQAESHPAASFRLIPTPYGMLGKTEAGIFLLNEEFKPEKMLLKEETEVGVQNEMLWYRNIFSIQSCFYNESLHSLKCLVVKMGDDNEQEKYIGTVSMDDLMNSPEVLGMDAIGNLIKAGNASRIDLSEDGFVSSGFFLNGIYTHNEQGDTLCHFNLAPQETEEIKGTVRMAEMNDIYWLNGQLCFRQAFSKQVCRILDDHTIQPVYSMDFGGKQASRTEGMRPSSDLSEKYLVNEWIESNTHAFVRFTQNFGSPYNREKGLVKFHQAIYDKKNKQFYSFTHKEKISYPGMIPNDIDGSLDFWPNTILEGQPYMILSGRNIKKTYSEEQIKKAVVLKDLSDDEFILMTIK